MFIMLVLLGIYFTSFYGYALFHSLAELFSVVIAFGIFVVAWNSRRFLDNHFLLLIGIAYLFIGGLDIVHTLAYKGMGVFQGYEPTNLAAQLWISARYMEALSLFAALLFIRRKLHTGIAFLSYFIITGLFLASIFYWHNFPQTFVIGEGLTPFKVASEYIISAILATSIALLVMNRRKFNGSMANLIITAMAVTIASEMSFTLYNDAYGIANMIGHFLKIISYYIIYKAIIEDGLTKPYDFLFHNLKQREESLTQQANELTQANARLVNEIAVRQKTEDELRRVHNELEVRIQERTKELSKARGELEIRVQERTKELRESEEALRKREEELSTILASVPLPVFVIDRDRHVFNVNAAAAKFTNRRIEEMLELRAGEALQCLHSLDDTRGCGFGPACQSCKTRLTVLDTFETGNNHYQVEWHLPFSRGGKREEFTFLLSTVLLPTSKKQALLCIEDITERKRAEDVIRRLNEGLQEHATELEAANRELESFSYSVSHDLREPLRTIDGFSRILSKEYAGKLDDEGQRLLGTVRKGTEKMGQLISDLLAFSRLSRQHLKSSEVNMSELAKTVGDELKLANTGRKLDVQIGSLPSAQGDRAMLRQVLINLLSNAVKFTRNEDTATIEVAGSSSETENVYHVKDNGVGFDMQYAGKLFNIFQRLHTQEEFEGTGVGLAIVQRIVHRHGGRVWAESKLDEGATLYFALPRKGY